MLRALIFDFDGVIVDTESVWYDIYRSWLRRDYGYDLKVEDYVVCVGASSEALFKFLRVKVALRQDLESFESRASAEFIERTRDLPPLPGVVSSLAAARREGVRIGLCSSAGRRKPEFHLRRLGLLEHFDVLATAELFKRIKPHPDPYLTAAKLLGLRSSECLAVEDAANGLRSAQAAGMPCLVVPSAITAGSDFEGAFDVLSSLADFDLAAAMRRFSEAD